MLLNQSLHTKFMLANSNQGAQAVQPFYPDKFIANFQMYSMELFKALLICFSFISLQGELLKDLEVHILSVPCKTFVEKGDKINLYYTGRLRDNRQEFDSNVGKTPLQVTVGTGQLFDGFDQGLLGWVGFLYFIFFIVQNLRGWTSTALDS